MTSIADVENWLTAHVSDLRSKADTIEQELLPVVHDASDSLASLTSSPIVVELQQLASGELPSGTEQAIVSILKDTKDSAVKVADVTAQLEEATAPPASTDTSTEAASTEEPQNT